MTHPTLPSTQELSRLRPAQVAVRPVRDHRAPVRRRPAAGQHVETLVGDQRALNLEIRRLGGRLVDTGVQRVIPSGEHAGKLELRVIVQDPKITPRWAKICIGLGLVLAPTSALAAATIWLLTSLTMGALVGWVAAVLVALLLLARAGRSGGGRAKGIFVQVTTSVHVR